MSLEPKIDLFVDPNETPPYYWMDLSLEETDNYEMVSHESVPENLSSENELHIKVNIQSYESGSRTITVDIGSPELENGDEIHVQLLDSQQEEKGEGIIKTEDAIESTRPIP